MSHPLTMAAHNIFFSMVALTSLLLMLMAIQTNGQTIGVCYGMIADNLPPYSEVINLYKSNNFGRMRLYTPEPGALTALKGSNIQLIIDVTNAVLQTLATDPAAASGWVQDNVRAYLPAVAYRYIIVGNEVIPSDQAQYVLPAMQNIHNALSAAGLQDQIKVSTAVSFVVLGTSFPPSAGAFSADAAGVMVPIVQFLASTGAPLLANVYPYFAYKGDPANVALDYALFTSPGPVVQDGSYNYQNLFDAMVDSLYAALEKVGGPNVEIVVSETGWPSYEGFGATVNNARVYNSNLIKHVGNGTPRRPGRAVETYIFAMFNEDQKQPPGIENHWGLFYPNKAPKYPLN